MGRNSKILGGSGGIEPPSEGEGGKHPGAKNRAFNVGQYPANPFVYPSFRLPVIWAPGAQHSTALRAARSKCAGLRYHRPPHDAGNSWRALISGTSNTLSGVAFTADGQNGWVVGDGGTILVTHDGGNSWGALASGTLFSLRGVTFTADGQNGWAVGDGGTLLRSLPIKGR